MARRYFKRHSVELEGFMRNVLEKMDDKTLAALDGEFKFNFDDCPEHKTKLKKYVKDMKKYVKGKNQEILDGKVEPPLSLDDGDQSPVTDLVKQHQLKIDWESYMGNYVPIPQMLPWMSGWSTTLFIGDYQALLDILKDTNEMELFRCDSISTRQGCS